VLALILGSIPRDILTEVSSKLDQYCSDIAQQRRTSGVAGYELAWRRRGNSIILTETIATTSGKLLRYDSGKLEYESGLWRLFHLDVTQRWRRYLIASATEDFDLAFSHWQRNETGIFSRVELRSSTKPAQRLVNQYS
jgi:hypothetical protein